MLELVLAYAIVGVLLLPISELVYGLPRAAAESRLFHAAINRAAENLRNKKHVVSSALFSAVNPSTVVSSSLVFEPRESESFVVARSTALWASLFEGNRSTSIQTVFVNSSSTPEACDPFTSGNWSAPRLEGTFTLQPGSLLPSTVPAGSYSISALTALPDWFVVAVASTSRATDSTLFFFRYSPAKPALTFVAATDNATTSRIGFTAIAEGNHLVFAGNGFASVSTSTCANGRSCAQVHVFDLAADSPTFVSALTLATSKLPFARTASGIPASATALAYHNQLIFLGLQKTASGDEFNIINAQDPACLQWLSGIRIGRTVTSITVRDTRAFVTTDDPARELLIFDVSDPAQPAFLDSYDAPGSTTFGYGSASTARGTLVRLGRTYSPNSPEFELLDISTSSSNRELTTADVGTPKDPESVVALLTQDRLTFALLTHRLEIWDTHGSSSITLIGTYTFDPATKGVALTCKDDMVYLARATSGGMSVIDVLIGT
jgi:hypothetical protein